jgi:hypothetical protein
MVNVVDDHFSNLHIPRELCLYAAAELGPIVLKGWIALALLLYS